MYADPTHIRKHFIKVSLSDHEAKLLEALHRYTGEQKAALIRDVFMQAAVLMLHELDSQEALTELRRADQSPKAA